MTALARILLVEDDPGDILLVHAALNELNAVDQVAVVNDGVQALDYIHADNAFRDRAPGQPAVVLLDLKLPRMDGFEVLAQIRSNPASMLIPVVVLTSSNQERDVQRAYEAGANGYVVKTIDFDDYAAALRIVGRYWADTNEPPPNCLRRPKAANNE